MKPCPNVKCQSEHITTVNGTYFGIAQAVCRVCGMAGPHADNDDKAEAEWDGLPREHIPDDVDAARVLAALRLTEEVMEMEAKWNPYLASIRAAVRLIEAMTQD